MGQHNDRPNQKPGMQPDMDQRTPQSDQGGIGRVHGFEKKEKSAAKPEIEKGTNAMPQGSRNVSNVDPSKDLDDDDQNEVDDDDDRITQRRPARDNEPLRK